MAVVKAPLFSLDASGSVGKSIVYSKWRGRNYVRRHAVPSNPRSPLQLSVRAVLKFITQDWVNLDATEQATWADLAAADNITYLNAAVAKNVADVRRGSGPIRTADNPSEPTTGNPSTFLATAGIGSVQLDWNKGVTNPGYCTVIYRAEGATITPGPGNIVAIVDYDTLSYLDIGLTPGQEYTYAIEHGSFNGTLTTGGAEDSATPTA